MRSISNLRIFFIISNFSIVQTLGYRVGFTVIDFFLLDPAPGSQKVTERLLVILDFHQYSEFKH